MTNTQEEKPKPEVDDQLSKENSPAITGLRFCDMEVLSSVFAQLRCGDCGNFSLLLMEDNMKRKGCASTLRLLCEHYIVDGNIPFALRRSRGRATK